MWAREWALVREWEEWPCCDFLPLALCLGGSPTSAGIFEATRFDRFSLGLTHAERPRMPMVPTGASDDPAGIGIRGPDGAVRKVIEWSADEGLAGVVERHNFHFRVGRTHLLNRRRP